METFFFVYFHKDDIVPDLADTFPGNDVFGIAAEKTADLCRTGNNDCFHKSGTDIDIHIASEQAAESSRAWKYKGSELTAFAVKFRINGTSETAAGTDINYFFLL